VIGSDTIFLIDPNSTFSVRSVEDKNIQRSTQDLSHLVAQDINMRVFNVIPKNIREKDLITLTLLHTENNLSWLASQFEQINDDVQFKH